MAPRSVFVTGSRRLLTIGVLTAAVLVAAAASAEATLSITVPDSTVSLGSVAIGGTRSAQLGTVTVTASGTFAAGFTATVSSTSFKTGGGTAAETIATSRISYWSGAATSSGTTPVVAPLGGQLTALQAQDLSATRTACTFVLGVYSSTTTWNPTIVISVPAGAVSGTYTGTITHSVA